LKKREPSILKDQEIQTVSERISFLIKPIFLSVHQAAYLLKETTPGIFLKDLRIRMTFPIFLKDMLWSGYSPLVSSG